MKKIKKIKKRKLGEDLTSSGCLEIKFEAGSKNDGGNSDTFNFIITTPAGQSIMVDGVERERVVLTITGRQELRDFYNSIRWIDIQPF